MASFEFQSGHTDYRSEFVLSFRMDQGNRNYIIIATFKYDGNLKRIRSKKAAIFCILELLHYADKSINIRVTSDIELRKSYLVLPVQNHILRHFTEVSSSSNDNSWLKPSQKIG